MGQGRDSRIVGQVSGSVTRRMRDVEQYMRRNTLRYCALRVLRLRPAQDVVNLKLSILALALAIGSQVVWAETSPEKPSHSASTDLMVIGHRGAAGDAPENTLASIREALRQNADAIEVDLHQSLDGVVVAIHDDTVDRTTDGEGKVANLTLAQLKKLDAGAWFDIEYAGQRIPTLDEVLVATPPETTLILELKQGSDIYPGVETRVINTLRSAGRTNVILKSFSVEVLAAFERLGPEFARLYVFVAHIGFLNLIVDDGLRVASAYDDKVSWLQVHSCCITEGFVREAQKQGFRVVAWNVHDSASMREMIDLRVDAIETDYPALLKRILAERANIDGSLHDNVQRPHRGCGNQRRPSIETINLFAGQEG